MSSPAPLLDGMALVHKMDELHEDWTKWYTPTPDELATADWKFPASKAKDGFSRAYDPVNQVYRGHSLWSGMTYYYKEVSGNMSEAEVNAIKHQVSTRQQCECCEADGSECRRCSAFICEDCTADCVISVERCVYECSDCRNDRITSEQCRVLLKHALEHGVAANTEIKAFRQHVRETTGKTKLPDYIPSQADSEAEPEPEPEKEYRSETPPPSTVLEPYDKYSQGSPKRQKV